MKIGKTTSVLNQRKWFDELNQLDCNIIEIGGRSGRIFFDPAWVEKVKEKIKGYDLSYHSGTVKIFLENEQFTKAEIERLKAEIILCEIWGIKELIFHLKHDKLNSKESEILKEICLLANEHNVSLIFESNGCLVAEVVFDLLDNFPSINYNLDLGHLNVGITKGRLGCDLDKFLERIDSRTVYVHAHNNYGEDTHLALKNGTLNWKYVLSKLHHIKKVISETKTIEDNNSDLNELKKIYNDLS